MFIKIHKKTIHILEEKITTNHKVSYNRKKVKKTIKRITPNLSKFSDTAPVLAITKS